MRKIIILFLLIILAGCGSAGDSKEAKVDVNLFFSYEKSKSINYQDDAIVYIDDEEIGKVAYGSEKVMLSAYVTEGKHKIYLVSDTKLRKNKSNKESIIIKDGCDYSFKIHEDSLTGLKIENSD